MTMETMTIVLGVGMFTAIVVALVLFIIGARSRLVASGDVTIEVNGEKTIHVPAGGKLLQTLAANELFLASACGGGGSCAQCKCVAVVPFCLRSRRTLRRGRLARVGGCPARCRSSRT